MFGEKYFDNKEWQSGSQDEEYEWLVIPWLSGSGIVGNVGALVWLYQFWSFVFKLSIKVVGEDDKQTAAVSQFRVCILRRTRPLRSLKASPSERPC